MTDLNYITKLLDGANVEWMPLWKVSDWDKKFNGISKEKQPKILKFTHISAKKLKELNLKGGSVKLLSTGLFEGYTTTKMASGIINDGEVITIPTGGTANIKYYKGTFVDSGNLLGSSREGFLTKYIYYFILNNNELIQSFFRGSGVKHPDMRQILDINIPIPCPENPEKSLKIQAEIVRILDSFTQLTAELTAELTARQSQYEHYRDKLLTFKESEAEWKTLREVALEFGRGKSRHRPRNDSRLYGGDIPFIQTGNIRSSGHKIQHFKQTYSEFGLKQSKLWPKGTLCITIAANIAETSILGFNACFPDSIIGFVENPKKSNAQYVEYLISSLKNTLKAEGKKNSAAQSNINLTTFENTKFPFPSVYEQKRIVDILDKFETLTNSISEGLPREIELRQQQYEYYRDMLFNFPKDNKKVKK